MRCTTLLAAPMIRGRQASAPFSPFGSYVIPPQGRCSQDAGVLMCLLLQRGFISEGEVEGTTEYFEESKFSLFEFKEKFLTF